MRALGLLRLLFRDDETCRRFNSVRWGGLMYLVTYSRQLNTAYAKPSQAYTQVKLITLSYLHVVSFVLTTWATSSSILTLKAHAQLQFLVGRCTGGMSSTYYITLLKIYFVKSVKTWWRSNDKNIVFFIWFVASKWPVSGNSLFSNFN